MSKFKNPPLLFSLLLLFLSTISCASQNLIEYIKDGKSAYSIYYDNTSEASRSGANTLHDYLYKISGVQLSTTTNLAENNRLIVSRDTSLPNHAIHIYAQRKNIFIKGGNEESVSNAVYEFLEKFAGCRFYADDAILIPKHQTLSFPEQTDYSYQPPFKYRYVHYNNAYRPGYASWNKLTNIPGDVNNVRFPDWGLWVHSMFTLVAPEKYFASHPEYYALHNGKRMKTQLCLTNPDVLRIASASLAEIIKQNPHAKFFSVSQMDNEGFCECENCKAAADQYKAQSGIIVDFVNKIAAQFPGKTISTLAYSYSRNAPVGIKPLPNVNIFFCATNANRAVAFTDDKTEGSVHSDLKDWKKLTSNIFFWDYLVDFRHIYMPFPNYQFLQKNIQFLARNNIEYTFQQGWAFTGGDMSAFRCYLISRLLWNPDINIDSTAQDFLNFYYGPAGTSIAKFIAALNGNVRDNAIMLTNYDNPYDHRNDFLSVERLNEYKKIFKDAEEAVKTNQLYSNRVQEAEQSLRYCVLEVQSKSDNRSANNNYYLSVLNDFKSVAEKNNVNALSESEKTRDTYYKQMSDYQNTKIAPGLAASGSVKILYNGPNNKQDVNVLKDGMKGDLTADDKWFRFNTISASLTIDLGRQLSFDSLTMDFMHDPQRLDLLPEKLAFSVSADDHNFSDAANVLNPYANLGAKKEIKRFSWKPGKKISCRFLQINIKMIDTSSYATSKNRQPAMLCDEIVVY